MEQKKARRGSEDKASAPAKDRDSCEGFGGFHVEMKKMVLQFEVKASQPHYPFGIGVRQVTRHKPEYTKFSPTQPYKDGHAISFLLDVIIQMAHRSLTCYKDYLPCHRE